MFTNKDPRIIKLRKLTKSNHFPLCFTVEIMKNNFAFVHAKSERVQTLNKETSINSTPSPVCTLASFTLKTKTHLLCKKNCEDGRSINCARRLSRSLRETGGYRFPSRRGCENEKEVNRRFLGQIKARKRSGRGIEREQAIKCKTGLFLSLCVLNKKLPFFSLSPNPFSFFLWFVISVLRPAMSHSASFCALPAPGNLSPKNRTGTPSKTLHLKLSYTSRGYIKSRTPHGNV